jgi:hypothetical protein
VEFLEELDWELQAFCKANTKLELSGMPTDRRQAADRVDATAHHARQVVERVLWEYNCRWRESRNSGSSTHMRVGGKVAPRKSCRRHATTKLRCDGPRRT